MISDVTTILTELLERSGINSISLPADDLMKRQGEILLMNEVSIELDVVNDFTESVRNEYSAIVGTDPNNVTANDGALLPYITNQRESAYLLLELLQRGYGKVVAVKLPDGSLKKYRVAQANRSVIKGSKGSDLMVVNRLAPIASQLVSAEVGDFIELPKIGEVEVVAVDLLDRSQQCDHNDFSKIDFSSTAIDETLVLKQLKHSFAMWLERWQDVSDHEEQHRDAALTVAEENQEENEYVSEEISLGSSFYTRTTRQQEELLGRRRGGLVIVEGIAGSGKTSVALGRLKVLHDAQFGYDEDGEHQSDNFFAHKHEMVGFVRHAQLVEYLKTTIDELNLSGIPVKEFKELQIQLVQRRAQILQLKMPGTKGGSYTRAPDGVKAKSPEGQMAWLKLVEREMLQLFLRQIRERLQENKNWCATYFAKEKAKDPAGFVSKATYFDSRDVGEVDFQALMEQAWKFAEAEMESFANGFKSEPRYFSLDRFIVRIKAVYDKIYDIVEEKSIWHLDSSKNWTSKPSAGYLGSGYTPFRGSSFSGRLVFSQIKRMREQFREQVRQILHAESRDEGRWLPKLADWYREVIDSESLKKVAHAEMLNNIRDRLDNKHLTAVDINLLLAISQIMSRDHDYRDDDQKRLVAALSSPKFYSSVFIDEVQDFQEIEVFLMSSMADPERGAVTVVGDFMQQLYDGTVKDLGACFPYAQPSEKISAQLTENKRQIPNLAAFSSNIRRKIGDKSVAVQVVPDNIPELIHQSLLESEIGERIGEMIASISSSKSICVISPTASIAHIVEVSAKPHIEALFRETKFSSDNRDLVKRFYVHFTEPRPTKGLEFDVVVVTHFNQFDFFKELDAHGAYVAVTRAKEKLILLDII